MTGKKQIIALKTIILLLTGTITGATIDVDWLITPVKEPVRIEKRLDGKEIVLSNGLIRRTFRLQPNAVTVAYDNLMTGESIIRGVKPEAIVKLDGKR